MRSAELAYKIRLACTGSCRVKQLSPGPLPLAGFGVTPEARRPELKSTTAARIRGDLLSPASIARGTVFPRKIDPCSKSFVKRDTTDQVSRHAAIFMSRLAALR